MEISLSGASQCCKPNWYWPSAEYILFLKGSFFAALIQQSLNAIEDIRWSETSVLCNAYCYYSSTTLFFIGLKSINTPCRRRSQNSPVVMHLHALFVLCGFVSNMTCWGLGKRKVVSMMWNVIRPNEKSEKRQGLSMIVWIFWQTVGSDFWILVDIEAKKQRWFRDPCVSLV